MQRTLTVTAAGILLALLTAAVSAHHNVEEMIRQFTELIETGGDDTPPEVYYRRATEYRVTRKFDKARADLEKAIELAPEFIAAHEDLGRLHQLHGDLPKAIASLDKAVAAATTDREKAASLAVRAEILASAGKTEDALTDVENALETYKRGAVDWFLLRSDLQDQLDQKEARLKGLKAGHARTKSVVLYNAWVEALVETGDYETARPIIGARVAAARLKSSWLIRRAKLHLATDEKDAAIKDLQQAITELNQRLNPENPDITLLIDRGIAHQLLEDRSAAKKDLAAAKKAGADRWATARLEKALGVELQSN
ncbi:MAG: tetratricopeptide (TPR) repeat protein [Verrucomicrobiales bacterium]|jgi:tetratricopeptide (TPR) repeat protein